jgi:hypothetical protein
MADKVTDAICFEMVLKQRDEARRRIETLETALREIIQEDALTGKTVFVGDFGKIARKALGEMK